MKKIKIKIDYSIPSKEFEYMQNRLHQIQGFDFKNQKDLYDMLYAAIYVAICNKIAANNSIESHIRYLVNFCKSNFIDNALTEEAILQLHANIVPPEAQSAFIYENQEKKLEKIERGKYRTIETYLINEYMQAETNFSESIDIQKKMQRLLNRYNNSPQKIKDITFFMLEFLTIHPFMDGNGKVSRVLFDVLLIKSGYYPSLFNKNKDIFNGILCKYNYSSKAEEQDKLVDEFIGLLLRPLYKDNYFS